MKKLFKSYCGHAAEQFGNEHPFQHPFKLDNQCRENSVSEFFISLLSLIPQPKPGSLYVPRLVRFIPAKGGGTALV